MIRHKNLLIAYRLFFALLGFSALITEIVILIERGKFNPVNFLSFFTVESNILVVVTFLLSALAVAVGKPRKFDALRSATTVYIIIVGVGFSFLLSGLEGVALTAVPWDNTVLHYLIPVAVLVDFLIDRPRRVMSFVKSLLWLLFPVVYLIYSLVRGAIIGWYPYPFLNPATHDYGSTAFTVTCLLVFGVILVWLANKFAVPTRKR
ncbi:MAG TPA: Pr6Pr family membrane protein [Candidatus Saccharimonadales bacterium]